MFRQVFEPFGRVDQCTLILDPITGLSSGSGFITFVDAENGETALRELDRFDLGGKRIRVSVVALVPQPVPKPVQPIQTKCFQLSNMFDPRNESGENWHNDIKDDVCSEAAKFGGALHVYVDTGSVDGVVYIMMNSNEAAIAASTTLHEKYFDGKMIQAAYIPEKNYVELFPEAKDAHTPIIPN